MNQLAQRIWRDIRRGSLKKLPVYAVGSGPPDPCSCVLDIGASCASPPLLVFDSIDHLRAREPSSWMPRDMWDNPIICESFLQVENVDILGLYEGDDIEFIGLHVADSDPLWAELAHVARMTRCALVEKNPDATPYEEMCLCTAQRKHIIPYSRLNPRLISDELANVFGNAYKVATEDSHCYVAQRWQAVKKFLAMREERAPF